MADKLYDVVVIGSGAGGGTPSARVAGLGAEVPMLEGGPKVDMHTDFNTMPCRMSSPRATSSAPAGTQDDHLAGEVAPFERIG